MKAPPCTQRGEPPNACARNLADWHLYGVGDLHGPWSGWRLAGRLLVSPEGLKLSPERLRGLAHREALEQRLQKARDAARTSEQQSVRVVVVTLAEFRAQRHGAA